MAQVIGSLPLLGCFSRSWSSYSQLRTPVGETQLGIAVGMDTWGLALVLVQLRSTQGTHGTVHPGSGLGVATVNTGAPLGETSLGEQHLALGLVQLQPTQAE